jgi:hypothetical protein
MNEQVQMLEKAAKLLAALNKKIVFIGGTTISLYLDEVSALDARPYLEQEIQQADKQVKKFIKTWFKNELKDLLEVSSSQLPSASKNAGREEILLLLIKRLAQ